MSAINPTETRFENYLPACSVNRSPGLGRGALRGVVAGMAAAALTTVASLPSPSEAGYAPMELICVLLIYGSVASCLGILPGLALGITLTNLARLDVPLALVRLIGALGAFAFAWMASAPFQLTSVPGLTVAVLCGAGGAAWVARGSQDEAR